jgi:hypothetical protein
MAVAPKKVKRSPAQIRAAKAFAATGRAAQAKTRAEAIKKTGKPPPVSKKQHLAGQKAAAAGRAAQAAKRQGKKPVPSKVRAAIAPEELALGPEWVTGCNDVAPTCASVAVAAHLQAATGFILSDEEILKMHELAGGERGASIENVLEVVKNNWIQFSRGRVRLLSFFQTDEQFLLSGLVVGVRLPHAGHAVLSVPGGMISWGRRMAWQGEPEEAWALEWGH